MIMVGIFGTSINTLINYLSSLNDSAGLPTSQLIRCDTSIGDKPIIDSVVFLLQLCTLHR